MCNSILELIAEVLYIVVYGSSMADAANLVGSRDEHRSFKVCIALYALTRPGGWTKRE